MEVNMSRISVQMTVSLPPQLYKKALQIAKKEVRSKSELVREALRDYIAKRERVLDAREELAHKLEERGIRTLEDVNRFVHEGRP